MKPLALALSLCALPMMAAAQTSLEYATMSRVMWAGFQCSYFAEVSGNREEQARLFELAYRNGRDFLDALEAGKIEEQDLSSTMPMIVRFMLGGPSKDFMLGRIFESAVDDASKSVYDGQTFDDELHKTRAMTAYQDRNCNLIK